MEKVISKNRWDVLIRMLGALGVVYGDIGTSVLYAAHESFFGPHKFLYTSNDVIGVLSLFFWSLVIVVGVKYVTLIMHADNHGEGGIFALLALITKAKRRIGEKPVIFTTGLIIMGSALLLAEGVITPAISVLSAVSGLETLAPHLSPYVIPITVFILIALFMVQRNGTHRIGIVFGPIMLVWFFAITAISIPYLFSNPEVFKAINPLWALDFVINHGGFTVVILGSVVLCITGAEALFADLGHFGRKPITFSWWIIVFPALILNYFGQGAVLLSMQDKKVSHLFYSLVPSWAMAPMIILATMAAIIASQALISGSFSLIQQAIALGVFPRQKIIHTNPTVKGQIYLPAVNWMLMVGCITLVIVFKNSSALAAAYGMSVTGTMVVSTIGLSIICRYIWGWSWFRMIPICGLLLVIDLTYFGSNLIKFASGGYVPVIIGITIFSMMHTWFWGRRFIAAQYQKSKYYTLDDLIKIKQNPQTTTLERSIVVLASRPMNDVTDTIPPALQSRLEHLGATYRHIAILSVFQDPTRKELPEEERFSMKCYQNDKFGSVTTIIIRYGFMEDPDLSAIIPSLAKNGIIHTIPEKKRPYTILSGSERIIVEPTDIFDFLRLTFFRFLLRNANTVLKHFHLDNFPDVSVEVVTLGEQ